MSQIGNLNIDPSSPFFILGPCALEMEDFAWQMARSLKEIATRTGIQFIFKASYDKANRTSVDSFRGPGVVEGCRIEQNIGRLLPWPRSRRGLSHSWRNRQRARNPRHHRRSHRSRSRNCRRNGRFSSDPRISLPPDGLTRSLRQNRQTSQRQKRPVSRPVGRQ